ncbi:palmitoyl-protein thioesterase 1 [Achlya hypogyna]|uniref:Palmitoyl-protein thioesterase 1 n=1 Tax=Achlya hypogyna TaxID=1202772 RepID=A0A0A7CP84_ACHHY|nr:secreted protein [Achlya hypogyna]OQR97632.1 palmitoyl-protein thioesterase 1 [Achlya hypogyna]
MRSPLGAIGAIALVLGSSVGAPTDASANGSFAMILEQNPFILHFNEAMASDMERSRGNDGVFTSLVEGNLPVVLMHGMGDAAGNPGMQRLRKAVATHLNTYVTNVQIGDSVAADSSNSFFMKFDTQVEIFAKQVAADPKLQKGFNAMGFSQGNLLIRGYIERFNDPPVKNFISVHGPLAGVGALPHCAPTNFICKQINAIISAAAYTDTVQGKLAQANYFRDPRQIQAYLDHALFLPDINNEKASKRPEYKTRFASLDHLALVRAAQDTMVYPHESEWFGAYADGHWDVVLPMNATTWYQQDSFGLATLDAGGKITLYETPGDHLQVSTAELLHWMDTHFVAPQTAASA